MSDRKVAGVIVAYHPDKAMLRRVIDAISPAVSTIVLVNNDLGEWTSDFQAVRVHTPTGNIGLAAAYNIGAELARSERATHILLLDQDSLPEANMVGRLLDALSTDNSIAAAGPLWEDARTGEVGGFSARFGSRQIPDVEKVLDVEFLISSGSLISLDALSKIGPFDEKLFIEHVDTDFALRAKAKGFRLIGVPKAHLNHAIGDTVLTVPFTGRRVFLYPPERTYYLVRNSIRLWFRPYATWRWRLFDVSRLCRLLFLYAIFASGRIARFKAVMGGVADSFRPNIGVRPRK